VARSPRAQRALDLAFVAFAFAALTLAAYLTLTEPVRREDDDLDNWPPPAHTSVP
jgi:hypothetical protein